MSEKVAFIKLQRYDGYRVGEDVRIAVDQISHYEPATRDQGCYVYLKNGQEYRVANSADMIDRAIEGATREQG